MENFVFGNLTHHKGLVPESVELQFHHKLCLQRLIRIHFCDWQGFNLSICFCIVMKHLVMENLRIHLTGYTF